MASVQKLPNSKLPYLVRYRDLRGKQCKKQFARKIDADRFATEVEHGLLTRTYVDPKAGKITLQEYAEEWRAAQVHRPSPRAQQETHLRRHVYPHLGGRTLADLRPSEVQAWVKRLSETLAPATVESSTASWRASTRRRSGTAVSCRAHAPARGCPRCSPSGSRCCRSRLWWS